MTDWTILVFTPDLHSHSATFNDVALGLQGAFIDLGYSCHCTSNIKEVSGRSLILGANIASNHHVALPKDAILYNLEIHGQSWMTRRYLQMMREHETWDYSPTNIAWLATQGVAAKLCRVGYHKCLERIPDRTADEYAPIDLLFYGSITDRRGPIIKKIWQDGIKVYGLFGCYGPERDAYIARAKIILNLHSWDEWSPLEIVRLQLCFANRKCVLTETCPPHDLEWQEYRGCMAESTPEGFSEVAKHLLGDDTLRRQLAQIGYEAFKAHPQSRYLADVLGIKEGMFTAHGHKGTPGPSGYVSTSRMP